MVQKAGMSFTLRSTGEIPSSTQVVIGDTMGELMLLYGIADLAFVGGSLVERGGHNPLEPAAHAIPVLMGPHTFNFKDICAKLQQDDGLITVTDADSLVKEVSTLLTDEDYRLWYGRHAVEVLHQNQGALSRLLQLLQPYCRSGAINVEPAFRGDDRQKRGGPAAGLSGSVSWAMKLSSSTPAVPTTPSSWPAASAPGLYPYRLARLWHSAPARAGLRHRRLGVDDRYR
jgi:hypothetical protein